jgi:hypothetical protein
MSMFFKDVKMEKTYERNRNNKNGNEVGGSG